MMQSRAKTRASRRSAFTRSEAHFAKIAVVALATVVLASACFAISVLSMRDGDGTYLPLAMLFPYSFLYSIFRGEDGATIWALALVQFPLYGVAFGHSWLHGLLRRRGAWFGVVHLVAVLVGMFLYHRLT